MLNYTTDSFDNPRKYSDSILCMQYILYITIILCASLSYLNICNNSRKAILFGNYSRISLSALIILISILTPMAHFKITATHAVICVFASVIFTLASSVSVINMFCKNKIKIFVALTILHIFELLVGIIMTIPYVLIVYTGDRGILGNNIFLSVINILLSFLMITTSILYIYYFNNFKFKTGNEYEYVQL